MKLIPHGAVDQSHLGRNTDFLYRLSLKAVIMNDAGEVLVVKEAGRTWWDIPGGGIDHDEDYKTGLARELHEEVSLQGDFSYKVIDIDEPVYLQNANVWQVRVVFLVIPEIMSFSVGPDSDEIAFMNPDEFIHSELDVERRIARYSKSARAHSN